jgi:hypothetical protein
MAPRQQTFQVGDRIRFTFPREPSLRDVPDHRLTAVGVVEQVKMQFARIPEMAELVYVVALETEVLGMTKADVLQRHVNRLEKI